MQTHRRLNCLQWLRLVERLLQVQMVATVAVVARNRDTYTCTVGQIVAVVAVVARRETSTQIVAVVAINQSRPRLHGKVLFTRVWTNFSTDELSPYTTRLRGTVQILLQYCLYKSVRIFASLSFGMAF